MMNEEQDIHKQPSSPDMLNSDSLDTDKDDDSLASELTDEEKESYVMLAKWLVCVIRLHAPMWMKRGSSSAGNRFRLLAERMPTSGRLLWQPCRVPRPCWLASCYITISPCRHLQPKTCT